MRQESSEINQESVVRPAHDLATTISARHREPKPPAVDLDHGGVHDQCATRLNGCEVKQIQMGADTRHTRRAR